jgi:hypothetical protein
MGFSTAKALSLMKWSGIERYVSCKRFNQGLKKKKEE